MFTNQTGMLTPIRAARRGRSDYRIVSDRGQTIRLQPSNRSGRWKISTQKRPEKPDKNGRFLLPGNRPINHDRMTGHKAPVLFV